MTDKLKAALAQLGYVNVYLVEGEEVRRYTINDLPEYDAVWDVLDAAALVPAAQTPVDAAPVAGGQDGRVVCDFVGADGERRGQWPHAEVGTCVNPRPASATSAGDGADRVRELETALQDLVDVAVDFIADWDNKRSPALAAARAALRESEAQRGR